MIDWSAADAVLFTETQACLNDYVSAGLHEDVYAFAFFVDGTNCNVLPLCNTNAHARGFLESIGKSGDVNRWSYLKDWVSAGGMFTSQDRLSQFSQAWRPIEDRLRNETKSEVSSARALIDCSMRTILRLLLAGEFDRFAGLAGISADSQHDPALKTDIHKRRVKIEAFRSRAGVPNTGKCTTAVDRLGGRRWQSGYWNLIDLAGTQAVDDDIRLLRDSQSITALSLNDTRVSDAAAEFISSGKWRANLRELWIRGTDISPQAVAQLRTEWPELAVWS